MSNSRRDKKLERIQAVQLLLLKNVSYTEIIKTIQNYYGLKERQAKRYIAEAKTLFHLDRNTLKDHHELAFAQLQHLKAKAIKKNDDDLLLRCLKMEKDLREEFRSYERQAGPEQHSIGTISNTMVNALQQPQE